MVSRINIYYIGVTVVAISTFFFVMYILPFLHPLIGVIILSGMLILMSIGYTLRIRRMRMVSKEALTHDQNRTDMTTQEYIQQVERLMGKK
ncbi:MAG: hypothetical protein ACFFB5_18170 [Promethearchaeota archaeon]